MNKKLIAVDLDGTLLNSESKLSPYTIETIQKVSEQGHLVIITLIFQIKNGQKNYP